MGVEKMYPKRRLMKNMIDDLTFDQFREIDEEVESGVIKPREGGFMRGVEESGIYLEEEEE